MNDQPRSWRLLREMVRPRIILPLFAAAFAVYLAFLHPWLMTLPGDEMQPHPDMQFTRAIAINAAARDVGLWIMQLGQDRVGFSSYDWLANLIGAAKVMFILLFAPDAYIAFRWALALLILAAVGVLLGTRPREAAVRIGRLVHPTV